MSTLSPISHTNTRRFRDTSSKAIAPREFVLAVKVAPTLFLTCFLHFDALTIIFNGAFAIMIAAMDSISFVLFDFSSIWILPVLRWDFKALYMECFMSNFEWFLKIRLKFRIFHLKVNLIASNFISNDKLENTRREILITHQKSINDSFELCRKRSLNLNFWE